MKYKYKYILIVIIVIIVIIMPLFDKLMLNIFGYETEYTKKHHEQILLALCIEIIPYTMFDLAQNVNQELYIELNNYVYSLIAYYAATIANNYYIKDEIIAGFVQSNAHLLAELNKDTGTNATTTTDTNNNLLRQYECEFNRLRFETIFAHYVDDIDSINKKNVYQYLILTNANT